MLRFLSTHTWTAIGHTALCDAISTAKEVAMGAGYGSQ